MPLPIDEADDLPLTKDEIKQLKEVARYWAGLSTATEIAASLGSFAKWVLYGYAIYIAIRLGVLEKWLISSP